MCRHPITLQPHPLPTSTQTNKRKQVALGRVIGGMCGGFVPLAQSAVADLCPVEGRAKFLGRIQVRLVMCLHVTRV